MQDYILPGLPFSPAQLKTSIVSPRKRSPSKLFTKLIKRDSDSVLHMSPSKCFNLASSFGCSTDDNLDYSGSGYDHNSSSDDEPMVNRNQFSETYHLGVLIGESSGKRFAAKILPTRHIFTKDYKAISKEIAIIQRLDHPSIIKIVEGIELFDEIIGRRVFEESHARLVIRKIIDPLIYLHQNNIAHRDIKPENIKLFHGTAIKILDFGFARALIDNQTNLPAGTLGYEAPEILTNSYQSCAVDMWALGVIVYIMLSGYPPFLSSDDHREDDALNNNPFWLMMNDDTPTLRQSIKDGRYNFDTDHWNHISPEAKNFITQLLTIDPSKRLRAQDALKHPWFQLPLLEQEFVEEAATMVSRLNI
eukprot:gene18872-22574_t